jgi:hypothetical protein
LRGHFLKLFGLAAAHHPAIPDLPGTPQCRGDVASDQQLRSRPTRRSWTDTTGIAAGLACPQPSQFADLLFQASSPTPGFDAAGRVIVGSRTDPNPDNRATPRHAIQRGDLLGKQRSVESIGTDQDRRSEADAICNRGNGSKRHKRLVVRKHDSID